jgi:hypothetical protein
VQWEHTDTPVMVELQFSRFTKMRAFVVDSVFQMEKISLNDNVATLL